MIFIRKIEGLRMDTGLEIFMDFLKGIGILPVIEREEAA